MINCYSYKRFPILSHFDFVSVLSNLITWSSLFFLSSIAKSTTLACPFAVRWFEYGLAFVGGFGNNFCTAKTDGITCGHLANKQLFDKAINDVCGINVHSFIDGTNLNLICVSREAFTVGNRHSSELT